MEWERNAEPSAGWELIAAAKSSHQDTSAHARALLAGTHKVTPSAPVEPRSQVVLRSHTSLPEESMKGPYGLTIIDSCTDCACRKTGFFCSMSPEVLASIDRVCHRSTMPAGAILYVEGQPARGVYVVCSGKVKLSTTSRDGKILMLKTAEPGEVLGLSAVISGTGYEMTAETSTSCQLNFVDRQHLVNLLQSYGEVAMHVAQALSRDFQGACHDIHDLILSRSSTGKLARLLLSSSSREAQQAAETRLHSAMTHEEMAQRIGSSRETVTRLLSDLKKKRLIRIDGATLVIRNRTALEQLAV